MAGTTNSRRGKNFYEDTWGVCLGPEKLRDDPI